MWAVSQEGRVHQLPPLPGCHPGLHRVQAPELGEQLLQPPTCCAVHILTRAHQAVSLRCDIPQRTVSTVHTLMGVIQTVLSCCRVMQVVLETRACLLTNTKQLSRGLKLRMLSHAPVMCPCSTAAVR